MFKKYSRSRYSIGIISILFFILTIAIFNLQIIAGEKYSRIAEKNYVRLKTITPIRGEIYDNKYRPIAVNEPAINLYVELGKIIDKDRLILFISENFEITAEKIEALIHKNRFRLYQDLLLVQNIPYDQLVRVAEHMNHFPSLTLKTENIRQYLYNNHFTGYVGRINDKEHEKLQDQGYSINSMIGKTGLEKYYESQLKGKNGLEILQVDASGRSLELFKESVVKNPVNGSTLILAIDNELQAYINRIFPENRNGAIVFQDLKTGGILAYVSRPDFDPTLFAQGISATDWDKLINDPNKAMLDRVIQGTYPPASTYKLLIAALGLTDNLIDKKTKLTYCDGGMNIGNRYFKCWIKKGHGKLSVVDAIKYSCDVFFYDLSTRISLERMGEFTRQNLLLDKTGIDLIGERKGFFPDLKWYKDNYGKYVGIIGPKVNLSIGQGEILTTPLQICCFFGALGNDGVWTRPHLLAKTIKDKETIEFQPTTMRLPIAEDILALMQESLYKAVNESYGTGTASKLNNVTVYGKTGSAENHMGKITHAWFAGYTVRDEPDLAFTIFLENAGHGGSVAAPLAGKIIKYYNKIR